MDIQFVALSDGFPFSQASEKGKTKNDYLASHIFQKFQEFTILAQIKNF